MNLGPFSSGKDPFHAGGLNPAANKDVFEEIFEDIFADNTKKGGGPMPRFPLPGFLNAALLSAAASWAFGASIAEIPHLPFGIDAQTSLEKAVITLDFVGAKTGAGTQRITLRGDDAVRLDFARSFQDKRPKSLERNCGPAAVIRLLDFMEGYGFLDMPDRIGGPPKGRFQRVLELTLAGKTKRVAIFDECESSIEEILGTVKVTAGQCLPEALNHRFFPNL